MKRFIMMITLLFTATFLLAPTAYAADVFNSSKSHAAHQAADAQSDKQKVILAKGKELTEEEKKAREKPSKKAAPGGY
jgi:hypothetical protein